MVRRQRGTWILGKVACAAWTAHKFRDHKQNVHITLIRLHMKSLCLHGGVLLHTGTVYEGEEASISVEPGCV